MVHAIVITIVFAMRDTLAYTVILVSLYMMYHILRSMANHSTTSCTTVLKEIIKYYLRGNSNVYCCLLDASKAFDKIHFGKLF